MHDEHLLTACQVILQYTANSIKVVLKKEENVEYERERLVGNV